MKIGFASGSDRVRWNAFVESHPRSTPYHDFSWKEAVEETYGHKGYYLMAENSGRVSGVLPLIHIKIPFVGSSLVSLPFCDIGGALAVEEALNILLIKEAESLARRLKADRLELREGRSFDYLKQDFRFVGGRAHKVRMVLTLPDTSELLWRSFKSKLRSQIGKAERNGLKFRLCEPGAGIDEFYSVFSVNMKALGSPVHSKNLFRKIAGEFKNSRVGVVLYEGKPVGAGIILFAGKRVSIPWASTLFEYNRLAPNMLLYWNFLKFASENGMESFDFGRSTPGEGTYRFKEQWGAKPVPLYWNSVHLKETAPPPEEFSTDSGKKRMFIRAWGAMPISFANLLGPFLRKYISL